MKNLKSSLILLVWLLAITGCSKKSNSISYTVNGLTDITVPQYSDTALVVTASVAYQSGTQEIVTLTPSNLPAGITVSPASISGTPSYANFFTFHIGNSPAGSYPISIVASSASGGAKSLTFSIIITPSSDCSAEISGANWTTSTVCNGGTPFAGTGVVSKTIASNQVTISISSSSFYWGGFTADLSCSSGILKLVNLSSGDSIGHGTFSDNNIVISYQMPADTMACTTTYTR